MRDVFEDIFRHEPLDPMESARRNIHADLRKRFFTRVEAGEGENGFHILLDGKPVRTPARRALAVPARALADTLVAEWDAQKDVIDPATMPLTRLCNSIIDGVADASDAVAADIAKYLGSDLVFYRADGPEGLIERETRHWDPVLYWARSALGAHFIMAEGVMFAAQPQNAIDAACEALPADPWRLGAMHSVTTLTGSALIALALAHGALTPQAAWDAAHVDEDWNIDAWGGDALAQARRAFRRSEFDAAAAILRHVAADKI
jgi:chaperone required for assembly of F1-ATPase